MINLISRCIYYLPDMSSTTEKYNLFFFQMPMVMLVTLAAFTETLT